MSCNNVWVSSSQVSVVNRAVWTWSLMILILLLRRATWDPDSLENQILVLLSSAFRMIPAVIIVIIGVAVLSIFICYSNSLMATLASSFFFSSLLFCPCGYCYTASQCHSCSRPLCRRLYLFLKMFLSFWQSSIDRQLFGDINVKLYPSFRDGRGRKESRELKKKYKCWFHRPYLL